MKITCPNCQKKYSINEAKLPPGIKNAKCKACGHLIPLEHSPAGASAKPNQLVKIVCRHCGQSYRLRQDKIPPALKTIKCKSCARPLPLSPASVTAPVHSLVKKSSAPPSEKPAEPPAGKKAIISLRCTGCGKEYKIDRNKVPPNVLAVKCKDCGYKIQLPQEAAIKTADGPIQPEAQHEKSSFSKPDRVSQETPLPAARPRKKKWRYAAAACVLLAGILGALVHFNIVEIDGWQQYLPGSVEKTAESSQLLDRQPFLVLNLNIPLVLDALQNRLEPDKKTARLQMMMSMMKSMALSHLELYLYATPNGRVLPVVLAHGGSRQQWENILNSHKLFKEYFTRGSGGTYRLKNDVINHAQKYQLPREPYQLT